MKWKTTKKIGYLMIKIWQILKDFARSFHQAYTSYFWRVHILVCNYRFPSMWSICQKQTKPNKELQIWKVLLHRCCFMFWEKYENYITTLYKYISHSVTKSKKEPTFMCWNFIYITIIYDQNEGLWFEQCPFVIAMWS